MTSIHLGGCMWVVVFGGLFTFFNRPRESTPTTNRPQRQTWKDPIMVYGAIRKWREHNLTHMSGETYIRYIYTWNQIYIYNTIAPMMCCIVVVFVIQQWWIVVFNLLPWWLPSRYHKLLPIHPLSCLRYIWNWKDSEDAFGCCDWVVAQVSSFSLWCWWSIIMSDIAVVAVFDVEVAVLLLLRNSCWWYESFLKAVKILERAMTSSTPSSAACTTIDKWSFLPILPP